LLVIFLFGIVINRLDHTTLTITVTSLFGYQAGRITSGGNVLSDLSHPLAAGLQKGSVSE